MNPEIKASLRFQSGGSMPLLPGARAMIRGKAGMYTVIGFDGHTYRLKAESGAELRAGKKAVFPAEK